MEAAAEAAAAEAAAEKGAEAAAAEKGAVRVCRGRCRVEWRGGGRRPLRLRFGPGVVELARSSKRLSYITLACVI